MGDDVMLFSNIQTCCFCDELSHGSNNDYVQTFGDTYPNRVIAHTQSFALIPSLGPIAEGHLLLLTKDHLNSFAELHDQLRGDALDVLARARRWLADRLGPVVIFEHGTKRGALTGACGITHAHVHIVPVGEIQVSLPESHDFSWTRIDEVDFLSIIRDSGGDESGYLYFQNANGERYFSLTSSAPSQFLRRHVSTALGNSSWNWRDHKADDRVLKPLEWQPLAG